MSFYRKSYRPRRGGEEPEKCADPAKARARALDALSAREMTSTQLYERLCARFTEQAAAAARYELAMTEIARREGIDITEADVDAKYAELSGQYGLSAELLRQQLPPLRLRHDLKLAAAQAVVVNSAKRK